MSNNDTSDQEQVRGITVVIFDHYICDNFNIYTEVYFMPEKDWKYMVLEENTVQALMEEAALSCNVLSQ